MKEVLQVFQIILAGTLIMLVLIQSRGTGFGRSSTSGSSFTRRGLEKVVFKLTFFITAAFTIVSLLPLFI